MSGNINVSMNHKRPITSTVDYSFEHPPDDNGCTVGFHSPYTNNIVIYLPLINTPSELYDTIEHEALHECFFSLDLDGDSEHRMIQAVQFAHDDMYDPGEVWF